MSDIKQNLTNIFKVLEYLVRYNWNFLRGSRYMDLDMLIHIQKVVTVQNECAEEDFQGSRKNKHLGE